MIAKTSIAIAVIAASVWLLLPKRLEVSVTTSWESESTLCAVEASTVNSLISMMRVNVSADGSKVYLSAKQDGDLYHVSIRSDLFETVHYRVPTAYPEIASDIASAQTELLFPRRSGVWRRNKAAALDQLVELLPRLQSYRDLPGFLGELRELRSGGVSVLTVESEVARYLYESTAKRSYLSSASRAYGSALLIAPNDPRVLACGIRLLRTQGREKAADGYLEHLRSIAPGYHSAVMRSSDLQRARQAMEREGETSLGLIKQLPLSVESRFLRAQWELLYGSAKVALAEFRKLTRETGLQHIHEWKLAAQYLTEDYESAVRGYLTLQNERSQVWLGEAWYAYAVYQLQDPLNARYIESLRLADKAFLRASAGHGREATLAKAWLGDRSALKDLPEQSVTVWELWDCWRVKTLLGERANQERRRLRAMGLREVWFDT